MKVEIKEIFYCIIIGILLRGVLHLDYFWEFIKIRKEFHSLIIKDKLLINNSKHPLLSYRYKVKDGNSYAICYVNFFKLNSSNSIENKFKENYSSDFLFKENNYDKEIYFRSCLENQHFFNENIQLSIISYPLAYSHGVFSGKNRLLIYQNTENIELSKLGLENTKTYIYKSKDNYSIYKGVVIYPNNNLIKMITLCESSSNYCDLNKLY